MTIIQPRQATVVIYQGDYLDRIRHLERRYEAALASERGTTRLLDEVPESVDLAAQHKALVAEAEESATTVTLKALGRKQWRALVAANPARDGNKEDEAVGVNEDTFKDVLVPVSILEPLLSEEDLDRISDIDFDRLYYTAFALNRSPAASPKALVSPTSPGSDETSN